MSGFFDDLGRMLDMDLLVRIDERIRVVEQTLGESIRSEIRLAERVGSHTLDAGGKRMRPALVFVSAEATGRPFQVERCDRLGACLEMIHMATLLHDDVIDSAESRRGRPTAAVEFGNTASILSGDVLLARAMEILAQDGDLAIIRRVSRAVVEMVEGEVREIEVRGAFDLSREDHLRILEKKTAAFIAACCEVGAMIAGSSPEEVAALSRYGAHVGLAFQIADDLLDLQGDSLRTGKPQATDFREGCATLPLILLRPKLTAEELAFARRRFGNGATYEDIAMISDWMDKRGAYSASLEVAREWARSAFESLRILPDTPARRLLEAFANYVVERDR